MPLSLKMEKAQSLREIYTNPFRQLLVFLTLDETSRVKGSIAPVLNLDAGGPILGPLDGLTRWGAAD